MSYPQISSSDFNLARTATAPWIIERKIKKPAIMAPKKKSPKPKIKPRAKPKAKPKPRVTLKKKSPKIKLKAK